MKNPYGSVASMVQTAQAHGKVLRHRGTHERDVWTLLMIAFHPNIIVLPLILMHNCVTELTYDGERMSCTRIIE